MESTENHKLVENFGSYIILDLEWNSVYVKKIRSYLNEIIEIGAVKLNKNKISGEFEIVDEFSVRIRPVFSRKLTKIVKNLTGLAEEDLADGVPFSKSMSELKRWIGKGSSVVMTWSNTDLLVLLENFRYFYCCDVIPFLKNYSDLQKYCQHVLETGNSEQLGLSTAAKLLRLDINKLETHRALDDSVITAEIFKKLISYEGKISGKIPFYCFVKPADDEFYRRLLFKTKFVSSVGDENFNEKDLIFKCEQCGETLIPKIKWFYKNHSFHSILECKKCELQYSGRVQTKITYDEVKTKKRLALYNKPEKEEEE